MAIAIWLIGRYLLRLYLRLAFTHSVAYAGIARTIAALLFLYVTALAILLGAELNATLAPTTNPIAADTDATQRRAGALRLHNVI